MNQLIAESEQRTMAIKADKAFNVDTRDTLYQHQSEVKRLAEKVDAMQQQVAVQQAARPNFVEYFVNLCSFFMIVPNLRMISSMCTMDLAGFLSVAFMSSKTCTTRWNLGLGFKSGYTYLRSLYSKCSNASTR